MPHHTGGRRNKSREFAAFYAIPHWHAGCTDDCHVTRLEKDSQLHVTRLEQASSQQVEATMLYWAAVFFVIALIAAFFGFGGLAAGAASIAKILFFVFLVLAVVSLVLGRRVPMG